MAYFLCLLVVLIIFETGYTIGKNEGRYHGKTLRQIRHPQLFRRGEKW